ncbi:hypothetical protein AB0K51_21905 [Kitasatospora sp. NPDC049285]|uniref:hypothetical protein n=1 Tax=Kitasatospora sp. NPDC049285 TaxID=3157096 RepID=UPI0034365060
MTARPVALRTALALYPARYRRDRGTELAEVFADTTAGAGRLATAREALDLAAYGLRLRTRLTATTPGGRLLAAAAPLLAGALVGLGAFPGDPRTREVLSAARAGLGLELPVLGLAVVPPLLAVAAALGVWRAARVLALGVALLAALRLGLLVGSAADWWLLLYGATALVPYLAGAALLVAAPPELLERPGRWWVAVGAVGGWLLTQAQGGFDTRYLMDGWWPVGLLVVPSALTVLGAARGRLLPAAVGVAVLPLTGAFSLFSLWEQVGGVPRLLPWAAGVALGLAAAGRLLAAGQAGRARSRARRALG